MAVITLRQLLHRPSPGGPISPDDPLPTRLYGGGGTPLTLPTLAKQQEILEALGPLATEEKLELVRALLESLEGKAATETTLAQAKAVLDALASKDYATQATLATAVTRLESILSRLESTLDVSDRAERELGKVTLTGQLGVNVGAGVGSRQTLASGAVTTVMSVDAPCVVDWWYWIVRIDAISEMFLGFYRRNRDGGKTAYFYNLVTSASNVSQSERYSVDVFRLRGKGLGISDVEGLNPNDTGVLLKGPIECPYGFDVEIFRISEPVGSAHTWFTMNYREV